MFPTSCNCKYTVVKLVLAKLSAALNKNISNHCPTRHSIHSMPVFFGSQIKLHGKKDYNVFVSPKLFQRKKYLSSTFGEAPLKDCINIVTVKYAVPLLLSRRSAFKLLSLLINVSKVTMA